MLRIIAIAGVMYLSYRYGEQKGKLSDMEFYVINNIEGVLSYALITSSGEIDFSNDMNLATTFNFWDAKHLKGIIKKFSPNSILSLETVTNTITSDQFF